MNKLNRFFLGALCLAAQSGFALASETSGDVGSTAIALASGDFEVITSDVSTVEIHHDPKFPIVDSSRTESSKAIIERLSDCSFFSLVVEPDFAKLVGSGTSNEESQASRAQVMWFCPKYTFIGAQIVGKNGLVSITFKDERAQRKMVEGLRKRSRNMSIVEGRSMASLTDPHFSVGPPLQSEQMRSGDPSTEEINAAALDYISALSGPTAKDSHIGMDFLNFTKMTWDERRSRQFQPISFDEVRGKLKRCKLSEGWPRRYDRDEERVFAFDSRWRCLSEQGPYSITLFLEIKDNQVAGGRLIQDRSIEDKPPLHVPVAGDKSG